MVAATVRLAVSTTDTVLLTPVTRVKAGAVSRQGDAPHPPADFHSAQEFKGVSVQRRDHVAAAGRHIQLLLIRADDDALGLGLWDVQFYLLHHGVGRHVELAHLATDFAGHVSPLAVRRKRHLPRAGTHQDVRHHLVLRHGNHVHHKGTLAGDHDPRAVRRHPHALWLDTDRNFGQNFPGGRVEHRCKIGVLIRKIDIAVRMHGKRFRVGTGGYLLHDLKGAGIDHADGVFLTQRHVEVRPVRGKANTARAVADVNRGLHFVGAAINNRHRIAALVGDKNAVTRLCPGRADGQGEKHKHCQDDRSHKRSVLLELGVQGWQDGTPRLSRSVVSATPRTGASPASSPFSTMSNRWRNCPVSRNV